MQSLFFSTNAKKARRMLYKRKVPHLLKKKPKPNNNPEQWQIFLFYFNLYYCTEIIRDYNAQIWVAMVSAEPPLKICAHCIPINEWTDGKCFLSNDSRGGFQEVAEC